MFINLIGLNQAICSSSKPFSSWAASWRFCSRRCSCATPWSRHGSTKKITSSIVKESLCGISGLMFDCFQLYESRLLPIHLFLLIPIAPLSPPNWPKQLNDAIPGIDTRFQSPVSSLTFPMFNLHTKPEQMRCRSKRDDSNFQKITSKNALDETGIVSGDGYSALYCLQYTRYK